MARPSRSGTSPSTGPGSERRGDRRGSAGARREAGGEVTSEMVTLDVAAKRMGVTVRQLRTRIKQGQLPAARPGREYLVRMEDVQRVYATSVRAQPERPARETEQQRIVRQLTQAGISVPSDEREPPPILSGDTPNTPRAERFTDAAARLVTGRPYGGYFAPTEEQATALHVCMKIAAMFGKKDARLSERERLLLRRLGDALEARGTGERETAKALAVMLVDEARERYRRAKRGGAMGLIARMLVGDLGKQCSQEFWKLRNRDGLEFVQVLLGDETDSATIVGKLMARVGWVESARSSKQSHVVDAVRKAYKRERP
jgi:excisionase family DNA binding protein